MKAFLDDNYQSAVVTLVTLAFACQSKLVLEPQTSHWPIRLGKSIHITRVPCDLPLQGDRHAAVLSHA